MSAPTDRPDAMTHLGVLYDDPDDLVGTVAPHVDRALGRGDAVSTLVDRRVARGLREALGDDRADELLHLSPRAGAPCAEHTLRRFREVATSAAGVRGRRVLLLAQYSASSLPEAELAVHEAGLDVVLGDLPLTMLCACARDAAPELLDTVHHSHPLLLDAATGATDNPAFLPPPDRSPTDAAVWGGVHVLRLHFGATADLVRVRTHVAALAAEIGLRGEPAQAAVLAVHEAAVVACHEVADARTTPGAPDPVVPTTPADEAVPAATRGRPGPGEECVLDLWSAGARLVARVHGPRLPGGAAASGPGPLAEAGDARLPRDRRRMAGPLRLVSAFCDDVSTRATSTSRTTRVVTRS